MALLDNQHKPETERARFQLYAAACRHLAEADPVMARLIALVGPCHLRPRRQYFITLCDSIISQQLSAKVAATIFDRFAALYPRQRPTPQGVASTPLRKLYAAGLSRQKAEYLQDLATGFLDGRVATKRFGRQSNDQIIESLVRIRGVGRWTAEMFLIFSLNRLNVLPVDDLGIKKALQLAYNLPAFPTPHKIRTVGQVWHPFETIASWYLWRSLQAEPAIISFPRLPPVS